MQGWWWRQRVAAMEELFVVLPARWDLLCAKHLLKGAKQCSEAPAGAPGTLGSTFWGRSEKRKVTYLDLTIFLLKPHFGGDGLVTAVRH